MTGMQGGLFVAAMASFLGRAAAFRIQDHCLSMLT